MLAQRLRRWANIKPASVQRLQFDLNPLLASDAYIRTLAHILT